MRQVVWFPLEPLEERYTEQMDRWVCQVMDDLGVDYLRICPATESTTIENGEWLDTYASNDYRARQVQDFLRLYRRGQIDDGAVVLLGDVWFPGCEMFKLVAELAGKTLAVSGWHHAGTFDPYDLLNRTLGNWGKAWEEWLLESYLDHVCVGGSYHASFLSHLDFNPSGRGQVWNPDEVKRIGGNPKKHKTVVFTHRIAPEKNPDHFYQLAETFKGSGWDFAVSTSSEKLIEVPDGIILVRHDSKDAYYRYLAGCSIMYSSADQETFGYSLHESIALGVSVVAPFRASYPEMLNFDPDFLYPCNGIGEDLLRERMADPCPVPYQYTSDWANSAHKFIREVVK